MDHKCRQAARVLHPSNLTSNREDVNVESQDTLRLMDVVRNIHWKDLEHSLSLVPAEAIVGERAAASWIGDGEIELARV